MIEFDTMLVHVGEFGIYQKILFAFQAPFCLFVTFVLFGQLFMYLYPRIYWCEDQCLKFTNLSPEQSQDLSVPFSIDAEDFDPGWTYNRTEEQTLDLITRARRSCQKNCTGDAMICEYFEEDGRCEGVGKRAASNRVKRQYISQPGSGTQPFLSPKFPQLPKVNKEENTGLFRQNPGVQVTEKPENPTYDNIDEGKRIVNSNNRPRPPPPSQEQAFSCEFVNYETATDSTEPTSASSRKCLSRQICTAFLDRITIIMKPRKISSKNPEIRPCEKWTYPYIPGKRHLGLPYPTVVSDAGWWRDPETRITIANAVFYIGAIIGGIGIGFIADNRGRIPALITANVLGCVGGVATAFTSSNFVLFCFCRFLTGMSFDNCFSMIYILDLFFVGLTLVLEYVGPSYRTLVANLSIAVFYTIGTLVLPWMALTIGNWKYFALAISIPMLLAVPAIFVVPESARWLLSKGRTKEATTILRSFAKVNRKKVDEKIFEEFEEGAKRMYEEITKEEDASLLEALKRPRIAKHFILLSIIWPLIALLYDGHSRNILNFGDNVFLSFTIASSTEFPADMILVFTLDRFGRRWLAFGSLILSGAFSFVSACVPQTPDMATSSLATALVSRFWVNIAFNIGLQYAAELLPTVIRAQGLNLIHIMGYVTSICSPFIASIGRSNPELSLVILGGCAFVAGALTLFLPETLGEDLPNTLEEGEAFGMNQSFWNCPICAKPKRVPCEAEVLIEPTAVQLRHSMKASLRGEMFRSSIIRSSHHKSADVMQLNPSGPTEKTRLRRVFTK